MSLENYPNFLLNFSGDDMKDEEKHFYQFKSFRLNVRERQLLKNGNAVSLTPKAFDLLAALVERNGHLVEKDELLRTVWADSFVEEANIPRIVHTLRKVLGEDENGNKFIETVAKKGYRFVADVSEISQPFAMKSATGTGHSLTNLDEYSEFKSNFLSNNLLPIIGRKSELTEIEGLLGQSDIRLITITGVGGSGKTRLAQAILEKSISKFIEGTYFIDLSTIENPDLVIPVIGQILGIYDIRGKSLKDNLVNFLREKNMLIVLDNFEQITEAASCISELLAGTLNLKILITSRVRLNLRLEHEFVLLPLNIPGNKKLTLEELSAYSAIELFVKSVKKVKRDFDLTEENAESVAEICRRFDGLPLAIELAAVRLKLLTPQSLLLRLKNSLKLLTGGAKDLPERQQTMSRAIGWSYDLLDLEEKKLLNRLAVFAGGFTLEAAEAVGNAEDDLNGELFDIISLLLDKSLLIQIEQSDGEPRFRMLTVVREFMLEKAAESGEMDKIKRHYAAFYTALSEKAGLDLNFSAFEAQWLNKLEQEHENLRAVIVWLLENEPQTALRVVGAISRFWKQRCYLAEGIKWMKQALEKNEVDADPVLYAKVCRSLGNLSCMVGDFEAGSLFLEKSLVTSRKIDSKKMIAQAVIGLGGIKFLQRNFRSAKAFLNEGLSISREINDKTLISIALNNLGVVVSEEKNYSAAQKYYDEAFEIARKESLNSLIPYCLASIASIEFLLEDYQSSRKKFLKTLQLSQELGNKSIIIESLDGLAALAVKAGEMVKAARLWGAAEVIYEQTGYKIEELERNFKYRYRYRYCKEVENVVGGEAFEAAIEEGRQMNISKVIALACKT